MAATGKIRGAARHCGHRGAGGSGHDAEPAAAARIVAYVLSDTPDRHLIAYYSDGTKHSIANGSAEFERAIADIDERNGHAASQRPDPDAAPSQSPAPDSDDSES